MITSGGGPHISVGIFRPKVAIPFLTNWFFALIREFGKRIDPLHDPVTWYGINYAGTQITQWDFQKQRKAGLDWYEFLCFGRPTASFASL